MSSRARLTALIVLITFAWVCTLLIEGVPVSPSWLKSFSIVQIVVAGGLVLFDRLLWKVPLVSRLLHRPVIGGTWRGLVHSSYSEGPIRCYLAVKQTYARISINLLTAKGKSHSLACRWGKAGGAEGVFYIYQLVPDILGRESDPVRFGGGVLEISGHPPREVHGPYWTDSRTVGKIVFSEWTEELCGDFGTAELAAFGSRGHVTGTRAS